MERHRRTPQAWGGNMQKAQRVTIDDPREVESNIVWNSITQRTQNYKTKSNLYQYPKSNTQISTVLKYGTPSDIGRLTQILSKHTSSPTELIKMLAENPTDDIVYRWLSNCVRSTGKNQSADAARGVVLARKYYSQIKNTLKLPKTPKYLDIGGKEGAITKEFGSIINASSIDIVEVDKYDVEGINYHIVKSGENYTLPYEDNSFDIITAFMVLHHVESLDQMVKEITRVCKPNGVVVIFDHDCWDSMDAMLIDIEHLIYQVGDEGFDPIKDSYYMRYFSRGQLREILYPMKQIASGYDSTLKNQISADRKFYSVFTT